MKNETNVSVKTHQSQKSSEKKRCPCGHDKSHFLVSKKGKYSWSGWLWVTLIGVTTRPLMVEYRCRKCDTIFDSSADAEDLDAMA